MVLEQIVSKTGDITTTCTKTEVIVVIVTKASFMNTPQTSEVWTRMDHYDGVERGFIEMFQELATFCRKFEE